MVHNPENNRQSTGSHRPTEGDYLCQLACFSTCFLLQLVLISLLTKMRVKARINLEQVPCRADAAAHAKETKHNEEQLAQFLKTVPRDSYTIATKLLVFRVDVRCTGNRGFDDCFEVKARLLDCRCRPSGVPEKVTTAARLGADVVRDRCQLCTTYLTQALGTLLFQLLYLDGALA